ncbi:hypothetical protein CYLTODRAFT_399978 [Cylindrobasidium torrendii FP15055 ss-10]|uniref:Polynucleotide 5'-hydroxyl-kinase GRC3 n=1 Tax=Cylindrobasidium torrendii FP15055 ss-10 TaxID=1314674 RepID=A0A0D7B879_9AGAR|nr:hypothetical protein CYLTODRAFT_399978 [Cylindrobasidium torrendii FP15055 ss-10]
MLSAVAARKAAQANRQHEVSPKTLPPAAKPKSKRKDAPSNESPSKNKKKKNERTPKRIVQQPTTFQLEADIIPIALDHDDEDDEPILQPTTSRAWSPSVPAGLDSSDEEDEEEPVPDEITAEPIPGPSTLPIKFIPVKDQNVFPLAPTDLDTLGLDSSPASAICLNPGEEVSFIGAFKLRVLSGSITIFGTTLSASTTMHNIYAPKSSPIPVVRVASSAPSSTPFPHSISRLDASRTTIVVQELRTGIQGLGRICGVFEGAFSHHDSTFDFGVPGIHMVDGPVKNVQPFELPPSWAAALDGLDKESKESTSKVYVVQGAKKAGKSTFARTLCNRLLAKHTRVAYLECDLGQSEFTPGGMVALNIVDSPLLGPPFTHPSLPVAAHYIGATTPKSSPSHYLSAIQACLEFYRLDIHTPIDDFSAAEDDTRISDAIPLVVNTMGWTKGLGADLLNRIHDLVQPTRTFEIEAPLYDDAYNPPTALTRDSCLLKPILRPVNTPYAASDMRSLNILSYLHAVFPDPEENTYRQGTATSWDTSLPLCAQPPYAVDPKVALDAVILTGAGAEDVVASEIDRVLNVALVGLVEAQDAGDAQLYVQGAAPPLPAHSKCHGLALVRGVRSTTASSTGSSALHILTPLPPSLLGKTRVLVKGEMELPIWGMLDFRLTPEEQKDVPYLQWHKGAGIGAEKRKVRRNLMRKAQM